MSDLKLVIGDKNRSASSLRAWLVLKQLGLSFEEIVIPLDRIDTPERILRHSPSGTLPLLMAGEIKVWDALGISEFLADHFVTLWPHGAEARALARSVCGELHAGFRELDTFLPMDIAHRYAAPGRLLTHVARAVRRVTEIWNECRTYHGRNGPFLFGEFTIADAMFAPVCTQLTTHSLPLDDMSRAYVAHMLGLPSMQEWTEAALAEVAARPAPARVRAIEEVPEEEIADAEEPAYEDGQANDGAFDEDELPVETIDEVEPEEDQEDGPPAPGLPGVVPTKPYAPDPEPTPAAAAARLRGGLFRWRVPAPAMRNAPPQEAEPEPVIPARLRRPSVPTPATTPAAARPAPPAPSPAAPPAEETMEPSESRYAARPDTIKPIGDGTRRRR